MVSKRKLAIGKQSKKPGSGTEELNRRKATPKELSVIPAKVADILSVLDNSTACSGVTVGHIVEARPVSMSDVDEYFLGEVVAVKQVGGSPFFYIHFLGEDPKIDDWVPRDHLGSLSAHEIEERLGVKGLNAPFFGLSSFSATASASQPRFHIKSVRGVQLGNSVVLRAWYPSPYPEMVS